MKKSAITLLFCLSAITLNASDLISNFEIKNKTSDNYRANQLKLSEYDFEEASINDYNEAVTLNNNAIEALNSGNPHEAAKLLERAVSLSPASKGFRNNYLIALNQSKNSKKLIEQASIQLSLDPEDHKTAYLIGITYLNELKENLKAADYFSYALNRSEDPNYAIALITALENTGKYSNTVFNLLEKYSSKANDPYLYYLLGLKYLEKSNYSKALKAFGQSKKYDNKGYGYHAYIRAAFYGGFLKGLEQTTKETLNKFPKDQNRNSTQRIYNSLKNGNYNFREHITLKINGASALEELNFNIRPIKSFNKHQIVELLQTEIVSKGKKVILNDKPDNNGLLRITVPKELWSPEISLNIKYNIKTQAIYGLYIKPNVKPNINELSKDELFSLNDKRLDGLIDYINNYQLEDSYGIDTPEKLFVVKAATLISNGLKYKENNLDKSVSWALSNLSNCDCTEYSRLLAALCLKKGIPARLALGFLIKNELIDKDTSIGHEWCEVYIDNLGWTPVDATLQSTMHRAYLFNILNDQIFFEYPSEFEKSRVGVDYTAKNSNISISIENSYRISKNN